MLKRLKLRFVGLLLVGLWPFSEQVIGNEEPVEVVARCICRADIGQDAEVLDQFFSALSDLEKELQNGQISETQMKQSFDSLLETTDAFGRSHRVLRECKKRGLETVQLFGLAFLPEQAPHLAALSTDASNVIADIEKTTRQMCPENFSRQDNFDQLIRGASRSIIFEAHQYLKRMEEKSAQSAKSIQQKHSRLEKRKEFSQSIGLLKALSYLSLSWLAVVGFALVLKLSFWMPMILGALFGLGLSQAVVGYQLASQAAYQLIPTISWIAFVVAVLLPLFSLKKLRQKDE